MDAISSEWQDGVRLTKVTLMKSARVGATKTMVAAVGYHQDQDPCSILFLQPAEDKAKGFSASEIQPMFRDVEVLKGKLSKGTADGRKDRQTMLQMTTPGGTLTLAGAKSPRNFRQITVRKVFRDEVDDYEATKREGDPIKLSRERMRNARAPQEVNASTPTLKGLSLIEREFMNSDQRYYMMPCPHCAEDIRFVWDARRHGFKFGGVKWPEGKPEEAYYQCQECGEAIGEAQKSGMVADGEWVATEPFRGHAGFHISALYSPFPGARWGVLAAEFLEAKRGGPTTLQPFVNTVLGETWDAGESSDPGSLLERGEAYEVGSLPGTAVMVTVGVDIQDDRYELEFVGWAPNHESWSLDYVRHYGDPSQPQFWEHLDEQLMRRFERREGERFFVEAAAVDSGGHFTDQVYAFCAPRFGRRIWAIKGSKSWDTPIWNNRKLKTAKKGAIAFDAGVNQAKMQTHLRLSVQEPGNGGYCHFPKRPPYDEAHFEQMTSERLVRAQVAGRPVQRFEPLPNVRNEVWDCRVYATVARYSLNVDLHERLNRLNEGLSARPRPAAKTSRRRAVRSSYLRD